MSGASRRRPASKLGVVDVSKSYGSVRALQSVTLDIAPREVHAIVGENGAGKSTLMRLLQGLETPDAGAVVVEGQPARLANARDAMALGIGMVHQEFMLVPNLTLLENFALGAEPRRRGLGLSHLVDWEKLREIGDELAKQAGVNIDWSLRTSEAPVHVRQIVEIIRLLSRGATTVILDEPTSILAPRQVEDLFKMLRKLRRAGSTILFISHKLHEVLSLADTVTVIRKGRVVDTKPVRETEIAELTRLMVGEDVVINQRVASAKPHDLESALEIRELSATDDRGVRRLECVNIDLRPGEIHGIAGVSGNGQDELVGCLAGVYRPSGGSVQKNGIELAGAGNGRIRSCGIGYVSPDRAHEGLSLDATIEQNIMAGDHRSPEHCKQGWLNLRRVSEAARRRLAELGIVYDSMRDPARSLSGGNQQRLVFARELAGDPDILIVSQPTRGVDVKGIFAIHELLRQFRGRGGSVLLVSEELEELIAICDRISVMSRGRIVGCVDGEDANFDILGRLMLAQKIDGTMSRASKAGDEKTA